MEHNGHIEINQVNYLNKYNASTLDNYIESSKTWLDVSMLTVGLIVIVMNFLVAISCGIVIKSGQSSIATYIFLGNLASADCLLGLTVVVSYFLVNFYETSVHLYVFLVGLAIAGSAASVFSVGLIALDRFVYILYGLYYQRWLHPKMVSILILLTWIAGTATGFLPILTLNLPERINPFLQNVVWCLISAPKYVIVLIVTLGFITLALVLILYSVILYRALIRVRELKRAGTDPNRSVTTASGLRICLKNAASVGDDAEDGGKRINANNPSMWRSIKMTMLITFCFYATVLPFLMVCIMYIYCDYDRNRQQCLMLLWLANDPLYLLAFSNSFINPVIYAWWHPRFRTMVLKKMKICYFSNSYTFN